MATEVNKKYEEAKSKFRQKLDEALKMVPLPIFDKSAAGEENITKEYLEKTFNACADGLFTIAVCGEVKAGKSTLLNSILFGDNVLPSFETPETAKLAFIRYTSEDSFFEVNWYNNEEWQVVRQSSDVNALKKRLEYSMQNGVSQVNCINKGKTRVNDLNRLSEYTSVPKKDDKSSKAGIFTPFVKNVEIYIKDENLRNLQIVDTPGLNDPNQINSNETTSWIGQAHAIIYVCPMRFFAETDLEFFRQCMKGRSENTRIFVQNRIDEDENYIHTVEDSRHNQTCLDEGLFGPDEIICSYSAQVCLSRAKVEKAEKEHRNASPDDIEFVDFYKDLNPDPDDLQGKISERLFANSGAKRLEPLSAICIKPYNARKRLLEEIIKIKKFEKTRNDFPIEKAQKELDKIKKEQKEIHKDVEKTIDKYRQEIANCGKRLKQIVEDPSKGDLEDLIKTKMAEGGYDRVVATIKRKWDDITNTMCNDLENQIDEITKNLKRDMEYDLERIVSNVQKAVDKDVRDVIVNYTDLQRDIPKIDVEIKTKDGFFTFKKTVESGFIGDVNQSWMEFRNELKKYCAKVIEYLNKKNETIFTEIKEKVHLVEEILEKRVKNKNDLEMENKRLDEDVKKCENEVKRCEQKMNDIQKLLDSYKEAV